MHMHYNNLVQFNKFMNVLFFICAALFGEGPPERRDRLRSLMSELGKVYTK